MTKVQSEVANLKKQGVNEDGRLGSSQVQAVAFDGAGRNAAVQVVETRSASIYASQSNQVVRTIPFQVTPHLIHLQRTGNGWIITHVDFDNSALTGGTFGQ